MQNNSEKIDNNKPPQNVLAFFARHSQGLRRWPVLALLAALLAAAGNFLMPQVVRFAVDYVIAGMPAEGFLANVIDSIGGVHTIESLLWCAAAAVILSIFGGFADFSSRMAIAVGTERFCKRLRGKLFDHIQRLPFNWHVNNATGDIIQRCTSDLDMVRGFAAGLLIEAVRTVLMLIVALSLMFSMNFTLAMISLAFIPVITGYCTVFFKIVGKRFLAADEAEGELTTKVQENLTGVRVVRAFGREAFEVERFDKYNNRFAKLWIRLGRTLSLFRASGELSSGLQILTVVVVGAVMAVQGSITAGEYLVFVSYNHTLAWPIRALGRVLAEMSKTGVSAARMQEILDAKEEPEEPNAQKPRLNCDIVFKNVSFAYGHKTVLKDLSFVIPKGSTFGILGATGSGKSTITYLLNRLYELPKGQGDIFFGDVNVRDIDRAWLRRNVGLVLQEPYLFSRTIEENIRIASPDEFMGFEYVRRAAQIASVDESIGEFAKGYETVVGERGVTLSGGQKQRVAMARTLMLKAPIMVFDDSMSAVDLETDANIRAQLRSGTGSATVILISHRINTLMAADNILVLEDGRAAQIGTHAQLIKREGAYKRIYDMQSEAAADAGETLEELGGHVHA